MPKINTFFKKIIHNLSITVICGVFIYALNINFLQAKETLHIGISEFPVDLHPAYHPSPSKFALLGFAYRPFATYDKNNKQICLICDEDLSQKKTFRKFEIKNQTEYHYKYKITEKAKWGDGTPISTKDILFTWEMSRAAGRSVTNQFIYKDIIKVITFNDHEFTFVFKDPICNQNYLNHFTILPAHIERPIFLKDPKNYVKNSLYMTDPTNPGLYFGPYLITSYKAEKKITYKKNPFWWKHDPVFKEIIIDNLNSTLLLEIQLITKKIDYIMGEVGLTIDKAKELENRVSNDFNFIYKPSLVFEKIDINHQNPILQNLDVRKAMLYGIDREGLNKFVFDGKQPVAQTCISPLEEICLPGIEHYNYNPELAKKLLDKAGWKEDKSGFRHHIETDETLSIEIVSVKGDRTQSLIQKILRDQLNEIGFFVSLTSIPATEFYSQTLGKRQFKSLALYTEARGVNEVPYHRLHSSQIPDQSNYWTGFNYGGFHHKQIDVTLEALKNTCDTNLKLSRWQQFQQLYSDVLPALPLYFRTQTFIIPKWLKGLEPTGHSAPTSFWVEKWTIKP